MTGFSSFNNSACMRVLNLLEAGYLRLREVAVERITVMKFVDTPNAVITRHSATRC